MNTNDSNSSNNPMNTGTGSGANYGTGSAGSGYGTGSTPSGSGTSNTSGGNLGNSSMGDSSVASGSTSGTGYTTGMFRDRNSAEQAYNSLSSRGYTKDDVNLLMSDETRKKRQRFRPVAPHRPRR